MSTAERTVHSSRYTVVTYDLPGSKQRIYPQSHEKTHELAVASGRADYMGCALAVTQILSAGAGGSSRYSGTTAVDTLVQGPAGGSLRC